MSQHTQLNTISEAKNAENTTKSNTEFLEYKYFIYMCHNYYSYCYVWPGRVVSVLLSSPFSLSL